MGIMKSNYHRDVSDEKKNEIEELFYQLKEQIDEFVNNGDLSYKSFKYKLERGISTYRMISLLLEEPLKRQAITEEIAIQIRKILKASLTGYNGNWFQVPKHQPIKQVIHLPSNFYTIKIGCNKYEKKTILDIKNLISDHLDDRDLSYHIAPELSLEYDNDTILNNVHFHIIIPKYELKLDKDGKYSITNTTEVGIKKLVSEIRKYFDYKNDKIEHHTRTWRQFLQEKIKQYKSGKYDKWWDGPFRINNLVFRYVSKGSLLLPTTFILQDPKEDLLKWWNNPTELSRTWRVTRQRNKSRKIYLGDKEKTQNILLSYFRMVGRLPDRKTTGIMRADRQEELLVELENSRGKEVYPIELERKILVILKENYEKKNEYFREYFYPVISTPMEDFFE